MKKQLCVIGALAAALLPLAGCQTWTGLETPDERYKGASLNALLNCRGEKGLQGDGESEAAWDRLMPGKTGMGFLDTPDGEEAVRILRMGLDENCKLNPSLVDSVSESDKLKLEEILNR